MPIRYTISSTGDTLIVEASGTDENLDEVKNYGIAVMESAIKLGCKKILCNELHLEYYLNTTKTYESARFIAEQRFRVGKIAIVCNPQFRMGAHFWETVAINRGLAVRVFHDLAEASNWLHIE